MARWLALERRSNQLLVAAREQCRSQHLEPPSPERLERLVRSVLHRHENSFCTALLARLPPVTVAGLDTLLHPPVPSDSEVDSREGEACPAPPLLALRAGTDQASLQSLG